ncbi:hypothetical protein C8Q76DRAFT_470589 [Earliella scabrosa]|nr:hypothetical protein C8Q76DRAFT_470589 [Earliella scabrosa]
MHRTRGRLASPTAYLTASILHSILLSCSLPVLEVSFSPVPYYNLPRCTSPPVSHSATTFRYSRSRNAWAHLPAAQRSASTFGIWAVRRSASCSQRPSVPRKYASPARNHAGPVPRYLCKIAGRRLAARRGGAARSFAQVPASPGELRQCHTPRVSKRGLREGPQKPARCRRSAGSTRRWAHEHPGLLSRSELRALAKPRRRVDVYVHLPRSSLSIRWREAYHESLPPCQRRSTIVTIIAAWSFGSVHDELEKLPRNG